MELGLVFQYGFRACWCISSRWSCQSAKWPRRFQSWQPVRWMSSGPQLAWSGRVPWTTHWNRTLHCMLSSDPEWLCAFGVGTAKEFSYFSGPIHGLLLDLDHLEFICRDHMIHGLDVATRFHSDLISRVDLAGLDPVLGLANLVCVDHSCCVDCPGVFCLFQNPVWRFLKLELACSLDSFCIGQVEWA